MQKVCLTVSLFSDSLHSGRYFNRADRHLQALGKKDVRNSEQFQGKRYVAQVMKVVGAILMNQKEIEKVLRKLGNPETASFLAGYFKTGPGEYADGDVFVGVKVPVVRQLARNYRSQPLEQIAAWLGSAIHEVR